MGAPLGNKNAAYKEDEREALKNQYLAYVTAGNYPSYFPECDYELVELWFESPTEKRELDKAKNIYKKKIYDLGESLAYGSLEKGNAAAWIFIAKNVLGFRDKQDIEHSGNIGIADALLEARKRANESD